MNNYPITHPFNPIYPALQNNTTLGIEASKVDLGSGIAVLIVFFIIIVLMFRAK